MKIIFLLILCLLSSSCSIWGSKDKKKLPLELENYEYNSAKDYLDHLDNLGKMYRSTSDIQTIHLSKESTHYLDDLLYQLVINNETFLNKSEKETPRIFIIRSASPFHFSTPDMGIYLSTGLLKKYIKNEALLATVLGFELIRSSKNIYTKSMIIPVGYISTERLISLLRVPFNEKVEINKWLYYVLRRSGFDPQEVLSWIQIKNKNTLDFSLQVGDTKLIAREESLYKAFIVKKSVAISGSNKRKFNSSKSYYSLSKDLEKIEL